MDTPLKSPRVTVFMPVYNAEKYLAKAIESILNQTFRDFEFLIINDGSTDGSDAIIRSFNDDRIRLYTHDKNAGLAVTVNEGLDLTRGAYMARMDADDISLPSRLEKEVNFLDTHPDVAVVAAHVLMINPQGRAAGIMAEDLSTNSYEQIIAVLPNENCIPNPTIMGRIEILRNYKARQSQIRAEDWDIWWRMVSAKVQIAKLDETLVHYRIHPESETFKLNRENIYLKKFRLQSGFFWGKLKTFSINAFDFRILCHAFLNFLKYIFSSIHPDAIGRLKKIRSINIFRAWKQYRTMIRETKEAIKKGTRLFFFFPYYQIGGAEKVHTQIVQACAAQKPMVFITEQSKDAGYLETFCRSSIVIDISLIAAYPIFHARVKSRLAKILTRSKNPVLFGCNSYFYYELLPYFPAETSCSDLMHGFSHPGEPGPELASLSVAKLLKKRVVITQHGKEEFRRIYAQHGLPEALLERVTCIPNYTWLPEKNIEKGPHSKLKIIYVGRDTLEKRVYLIGAIASRVHQRGIQAEFILAGPDADSLRKEDVSGCTMLGMLKEEGPLKELYRSADILLLTSSREGFPLVIMEAMALGVVCISTNVGGISEHIQQGNTGFLVSETEEEAIVERFTSLISDLNKNRKLLEELSANSSAYARSHFSKEQFDLGYRRLFGFYS